MPLTIRALALFFCCSFITLRAQHAVPDSARLNAMLLAGEECFLRNPDSSLVVWLQVDSIVTGALGDASPADHRGLRAIQAAAANNIALVYTDRGMMNASLEYHFRSVHLREAINDTRGIAESCNNIAFLYLVEQDTARALEYFRKGQAGYEQVKDTGGVAYTLVNQGKVYLARNQDDVAWQAFTQATAYFKNNAREQRGYATCLNSLGTIHGRAGRTDSALFYFRAALQIRNVLNDTRGIAGSYASMARAYLIANRLDSALHYARISYQIALTTQNAEQLLASTRLLSDVYAARKDYTEAYRYFALSVTMHDSIMGKQVRNELLRHDLNYRYGQKIAADSTRNAIEQNLLDAELRRSTQQRYFLAGGLLIVLVFAAMVFNRFRVTRAQNRIIEDQKRVVESKQKEIVDSMQYATRIQQALLAGKGILHASLQNYFVMYQPKDIVSGDFYWATRTADKFWLCIADCTGHGVPGAFMSLLNISFLNEAINERRLQFTSEVLNYVRNKVIAALATDGSAEGGKDGMDCVLCAFDPAKKELQFSGAYNPLWLITEKEGRKECLQFSGDKMPVGKHVNDHVPFNAQSIPVQKGDMIYLFTDGFADQFGGPQGKKFFNKRLRELLLEVSHLSEEEQRERLQSAFVHWKQDHEQLDDVLVMGIRI